MRRLSHRWNNQSIRKNAFACPFSVHNTISLSRHEQVCLIRLRFERYFSDHRVRWREKYLSKRSLIKDTCSWCDKLIVLQPEHSFAKEWHYFSVFKKRYRKPSHSLLLVASLNPNKVQLEKTLRLPKIFWHWTTTSPSLL